MAPRVPYALIYSTNPPAADIVCRELLDTFEKGKECTFQWINPKNQPKTSRKRDKCKPKPTPVYTEVKGIIISTGKAHSLFMQLGVFG